MAKLNHIRDIRTNNIDKQSEKGKRSKVYTSERIEQILKDQATGGVPDMDPFFHGQTDYRDAGVAFEYTDHEMLELQKCSEDSIYFVEHYCKFLNDKGRTLIKLRDYQTRLISTMAEEVYDEVSDTLIPKNRRLIVMQSRQTGKCVTADTLVDVTSGTLDFSRMTFRYWFKSLWDKIKAFTGNQKQNHLSI